MATGTVHNSGLDGVIRVGAIRAGDRILIVAFVTQGDDAAAGQQGFADLVATVHQP